MQIKACGLSDVGMSRSHNEDCFGIDQDRQVYIIADGMGGHGHGEVASRIAVEAIRESLVKPVSGAGHVGDEAEDLRPHSRRLKAAIGEANQRVVQAVQNDSDLSGMGTTVVGFMLADTVAAVAHVGDSRLYRFRDGVLELITEDHTWVNEQVLAGHITADQAKSHPLKSVVTRAIGGNGEIDIDVREIDLRPGDLYLMCTDGLTSMLSDDEILSNLNSETLERVCANLVQSANDRGGLDNVTVVLVAVLGEEGDALEELGGEETTVLPRAALNRETGS